VDEKRMERKCVDGGVVEEEVAEVDDEDWKRRFDDDDAEEVAVKVSTTKMTKRERAERYVAHY
jgi:hypothetical protein